MKGRFATYPVIAALFVGVLMLIYVFYVRTLPTAVDWRESFSQRHSRPYGTQGLRLLLDDLFPEDSIEDIHLPLGQQLALLPRPGESQSVISYLLINDEIPASSGELDSLLDFVAAGHYVFMASRDFPYKLEEKFDFSPEPIALDRDTVSVYLSTGGGSSRRFRFPGREVIPFQLSEDHAEVLAQTQDQEPVLIRVAYGAGYFVLSGSPRMLTNYYMIHPQNHDFIAQALSYLPDQGKLWWDEYYKPDLLRRRQRSERHTDSPGLISYLLTFESLRWVFWMSLLGVLAYVLVEQKRKQRTVPIHKPLPNLTLDFTQTVGRLYFQSNNHLNLAKKRIVVLLAFIREQYFLKTNRFDEAFFQQLAGKSGLSRNEIQLLFRRIEQVRTQAMLSEAELVEFSQQIDDFYARCAR